MQDMTEWARMVGGVCFVTDLGAALPAATGAAPAIPGRYAVWSPRKDGQGHVPVEVSPDLPYLTRKYGVPADRVFKFGVACPAGSEARGRES